MQFLKSVDLDSRVSVVLNRMHKKPLFGKAQVEDILGIPVLATLPNDYHGVNRSTAQGTVVDLSSELGQTYMHFAASLVDPRPTQPAVSKKKFLEYFSVPGSPTELQR